MLRVVTSATVLALALVACSEEPQVGFDGLPEQSASPSAEAAPSPTASAEATSGDIDVTTTPDEITPEWVTAVVNTLLAEYGEMTAEILAMPVQDDPTLPDGFEERLDALFDGEYLDFARSELAALLVDAEDRRAALKDPSEFSSLLFDTELVQVTEAACIVAVGRLDRSGTRRDGQATMDLSAAALAPSSGGPAAWQLRDLLANTDAEGRTNEDAVMLEATLDDYGSALDHTCEDS